jgi:nucleoside-diphosphate-sugar epimerase
VGGYSPYVYCWTEAGETMINILVTGAKGGVSIAFGEYMKENYPNDYTVKYISLRDESWKKFDFNEFNVVFHCAGIVSSKINGYDEFKKINVDLTDEIATRAFSSGIKKFILLSSMAVYGSVGSNCNSGGVVGKETVATTPTLYGKSKLQSEEVLQKHITDDRRISIIRAPSIIGKGTEKYLNKYICLMKYGVFLDMFCECKRSFIYIDNLCELVRLIIENDSQGIFYPQNQPQLSTSEFIRIIAKTQKRKFLMIKVPKAFQIKTLYLNKIYGNVCYSNEISNAFDNKYNVVDTVTAIERTLAK